MIQILIAINKFSKIFNKLKFQYAINKQKFIKIKY